ncbi:MAG: hypothetical protein ACOX52_08790 [Verrucomicrobiota bacterium]
MKTFNDSQTSDGAYPNVSPKGWGVSPAWGDAGVICPFMFYWAYGDTKLIREHYDGMCAWIDYLKTRSTDLIRPAEGFGDWLNVDAPMPKEVISTAYFAWSTQLLSELAEIIGKPEDAERYRALAAEIKSAFAREFISEDGRIHGGHSDLLFDGVVVRAGSERIAGSGCRSAGGVDRGTGITTFRPDFWA